MLSRGPWLLNVTLKVPGLPPGVVWLPEIVIETPEGRPLVAKLTFRFAATPYGPTNGPPFPTGGAPAGCIVSVLVSASARAILRRPLPVSSWVPAGSAVRAMRLATTPFDSDGSTARIRATAPATIAD